MKVRVLIPFEAAIEYDVEVGDIPFSPRSKTWRKMVLEAVEKVIFSGKFDASQWAHDPNFYEQVWDNIKAAFASPLRKKQIDLAFLFGDRGDSEIEEIKDE